MIEAQYMGKPAISYNNCSHPEVVFYGALANSDREFKDALVRYLSENGSDPTVRQKVIDRFATKNTVEKYIEILKQV